MRTGEAFQGYRLVTRVAFDKTGTLTEGRPRIREIEAISGNTDELLVIAAAAEASSEIGRAHVELQSLMRISYAVFCLKKKKRKYPKAVSNKHTAYTNEHTGTK